MSRRTSTRSSSRDEPNELLTIIWSFVPSRVVRLAAKAGFFSLFECDKKPRLSVNRIAARLGWARRPTRAVMRLLANLGLVTVDGAFVELTSASYTWLHPKSPQNLSHYFLRCGQLETAYGNIDAVVKHDQPDAKMSLATKAAFGTNRDATKAFVLTMHASALAFANDLATEVRRLKRPAAPWRFLDVGCGRATLSCVLHDTFRSSQFSAFDLQGVSTWARRYVREAGKQERIAVSDADWNNWPWKTQKYDVVLLSQVLHEVGSREASRLFSNASASLGPEGLLVVVMVGDGTTDEGDLLHSIFTLNILIETGGHNPTVSWLDEQAKKCGLTTMCLKTLPGGRSLWIGRKTAHPHTGGRRRIRPQV